VKQCNFFGKEREKQLVITNIAVFVQYTKYSHFETLDEEFREAINAIDQEQHGAIAQGLRYVNKIDIEGVGIKEWNKFISEKLLVDRL
jgi:uncharacterized protein (TIGR04255 family)